MKKLKHQLKRHSFGMAIICILLAAAVLEISQIILQFFLFLLSYAYNESLFDTSKVKQNFD